MKKRKDKEGTNESPLSKIGLAIGNGNPSDLENLENELKSAYSLMPIGDDELTEDEVETNMLAMSAFVEMEDGWTQNVFNEEKAKFQKKQKQRRILNTYFAPAIAALVLLFIGFNYFNKKDEPIKELVLNKRESKVIDKKVPPPPVEQKIVEKPTLSKEKPSIISKKRKYVPQHNKNKTFPEEKLLSLAFNENPVMEKMMKAKAIAPKGIVLPNTSKFHFEYKEGGEYEVVVYNNKPNSIPVMEFTLDDENRQKQIKVGELKPGLYYYEVYNQNAKLIHIGSFRFKNQ